MAEAGIEDPFPAMIAGKGFDLLCPFGDGKIVCIKDGGADEDKNDESGGGAAAALPIFYHSQAKLVYCSMAMRRRNKHWHLPHHFVVWLGVVVPSLR